MTIYQIDLDTLMGADPYIENKPEEIKLWMQSLVRNFNLPSDVAFKVAMDCVEHDCVDSIRAVELRTTHGVDVLEAHNQMTEYIQIFRAGCCGFHDEIYTSQNGSIWLVGFNYGH